MTNVLIQTSANDGAEKEIKNVDFTPTAGLRGICCFLILYGHFARHFAPRWEDMGDNKDFYPVYPLEFVQVVTFFFLLSGMGMAYFNHKLFLGVSADEGAVRGSDADVTNKVRNTFYWKRIARLAPMYYIALLWSLPDFIQQIIEAEDDAERNFLYISGVLTLLCLQTFVTGANIWNVPCWQVSAFVWCYILLPYIAKPLYRRIGGSRAACVKFILLCYACQCAVVGLNCPLFECYISIHFGVISRVFHFLMGIGVGLILKMDALEAKAHHASDATGVVVPVTINASDASASNTVQEEEKTEGDEQETKHMDASEGNTSVVHVADVNTVSRSLFAPTGQLSLEADKSSKASESSDAVAQVTPRTIEEEAPEPCYPCGGLSRFFCCLEPILNTRHHTWVVGAGSFAYIACQLVFLTCMPDTDRASTAWQLGVYLEVGLAPVHCYVLYHLCLVDAKGLTSKVLSWAPMQKLGAYSLCLYLLHWQFLFYYSYIRTQEMVSFRDSNFTGDGGSAKEHGVFVLYEWEIIIIAPLITAISAAAHHFIENPCRRYILKNCTSK